MRVSAAGKGFLIVLIVALLLAGGAIAYYQHDEALRPEVVDILNYAPMSIPDDQNGYYALLGLFVAADEIPHAKGVEFAQTVRRGKGGESQADLVLLRDIPGAYETPPTGDVELLCDLSSERFCLADIVKREAVYERVLAENALLVERLRHVTAYPVYQEQPAIVVFDGLMSTHKLLLADVALHWHSGRRQEALGLLRDDALFWRRLLRSDVSMITRAIGGAVVMRDLYMLSEFISDCANCIATDPRVVEILQPFTREETSLRKVMGAEYRFVHAGVSQGFEAPELDSFWQWGTMTLLLKPNAMFNKLYDGYEQVIALSECSIGNYLPCYRRYTERMEAGIDYVSLEFVADPVGTLLVAIAQPSFAGYVWQAHKMELLRRLIAAKAKLYEADIAREGIGEYLAGLPEALQNPLTSQPIQWDTEGDWLRMPVPAALGEEAVGIQL